MNRREVLRIAGGLAGSGPAAGALGEITSTGVAGHPTPSTDGRPPDGTTGTADDAASFAPLASLPLAEAREAVVGADGTTVYVATMDGFVVVDVADPGTPRLLAERRDLLPDAEGGPLGQIQEVAVDGDRLLVVGPAHPDADAVKAALLYDVSDPAEPRRLAVHRTDVPIHNADLRDGLAYLTATDGATNPIEIVALRDEPTVVGRWSPVDEDGAWASVPARLRPSHDVVVRDGIAYCSYWDAGTWLVDVSDPTEPTAIGRVGDRSAAALSSGTNPRVEATELPGNHHSAALDASRRVLAIGHEAWDADGDGEGGPGGITLVDVSRPAAPVVGARLPPPAAGTRSGEWTTAHNFALRDGVLYSAWYQGGVRVHDVSNPAEPRAVAAWRDSTTTRFWTAQVADDAVVAPSMGTDHGEPGLYTFPVPGTTSTSGRDAGGTATDVESTATTTLRRSPTATPGLAGLGVAATTLGGGLAWLLARRRRG